MGWPFATVIAPNLDTGPGVAVPLTPTQITAAQAWLTGAQLTNSGGNSVTVIFTNTAGDVLSQILLPPGAEQPYEWPFRPSLGVWWSADLAGVVGHVWGYV